VRNENEETNMASKTRLTETQVEKLVLALHLIAVFGSREEAKSRYQRLVEMVGDEEAARVLAAAR
jgi:hypothetical protein